ncbi:cupin domain-containing protein [Patescibacteria group bacterium]|nr:cupin domain-containing protein [Patescibacteria group bacterium]
MARLNVKNLPVATNVCEQVLREVEKQPEWSMAHVVMNPMAESLLHHHERMREIYVITRGCGELVRGLTAYKNLVAGSACSIPSGMDHMLRNQTAGHLEHLVFALPPFDPNDVCLEKAEELAGNFPRQFYLPEVQDCFDGAKILAYNFSELALSITFGWVTGDPAKRKEPHYHKNITEFVYVVEGAGFIELDRVRQPIQPGDWIRINPGTEHALINKSAEGLVVVCACSPAFRMEDVHYK